jgi:hypothetical protein
MGYEAHLNISLKVFGDRFLYIMVVKWTLKNKKVFVYVKCNYVTVGLSDELHNNIGAHWDIESGSLITGDIPESFGWLMDLYGIMGQCT